MCSPPRLEIILFFLSLYLTAFAQGGNKPCVLAFAADQFDEEDEEECKVKSSLFNWWNFILGLITMLTVFGLNYIQDNLSWELSFGIPCILMCVALLVFLLGTMTYRFPTYGDGRNPLATIYQVIVNAARNRTGQANTSFAQEEAEQIQPYESAQLM